ncbi:MAG: P1 family peptidase [Gammaproteobacteria bacterium]|nr:P1 family peptidase [Gammaproteobacteria bacterium]
MQQVRIPIAGLNIGHAEDRELRSGVTMVLPDKPATASVHVVGGAPGTRETDLLNPLQTVEKVDAIVLSGGSAFGLDAAAGAQAWLQAHDRGFPVVDLRVPIVPAAILFDLNNGGNKDWGRYPPYRELGFEAAERALDTPGLAGIGPVGAATGASTAAGPGGFGIASQTLGCGANVTAAMAVNAAGSPYVGDTRHFWAAPFEQNAEFGGRGLPDPWPVDATAVRTKAGHSAAGMNTTIGVVITDAALSKVEAKQIAVMAHDGFARALYPVHSPGDGDLLFVLSTGEKDLSRDDLSMLSLGTSAANTVTRAIARGIFASENGD